MHGLENQTRESIKLLKKNGTPFVIALNKIDRLYQWQVKPDQVSFKAENCYLPKNKNLKNFLQDVRNTVKEQKRGTHDQFDSGFQTVFNQMAGEEYNVKLFWEFTEDDDPAEWIPVVPTSAHSGDGMGNLMAQVIDIAQSLCTKRITYNK